VEEKATTSPARDGDYERFLQADVLVVASSEDSEAGDAMRWLELMNRRPLRTLYNSLMERWIKCKARILFRTPIVYRQLDYDPQ